MARRRGQKAEINIFGNAAFMDAMANTIGALVFMLLMVVVVTVALKLNLFRLEIRTRTLPDAIVGKPYDVVLTAVGGNQPYRWEKIKGDLPDGLELVLEPYQKVEMQNHTTLTGNIAHVKGVPRELTAIPAKFTMGISDTPILDEKTGKRSSEKMHAYEDFQITVQPNIYNPRPLSVITAELPTAIVGQDYVVYLSATGGSPPYHWSIENGPPPDVFQLDNSEGKIYGAPSRAAEWQLSLNVRDASGATATSPPITLRAVDYMDKNKICCGESFLLPSLHISTSALPTAIANRDYEVALSAVGGIPPYAWSISNAPVGMQVTANGSLHWRPSTVGREVSFTVSVQTSPNGFKREADSKTLKLQVESEPGKLEPLKLF